MTGSPSLILTLGFGNGTLEGSPSHVLTLGYGIGEAVEPEVIEAPFADTVRIKRTIENVVRRP